MTRRSVVGIAMTMDDSATHDIVYVACADGLVFTWCPDGGRGIAGRWMALAPIPGTQAARQAHRADDADSGAKAEPQVEDMPDVDVESLKRHSVAAEPSTGSGQ